MPINFVIAAVLVFVWVGAYALVVLLPFTFARLAVLPLGDPVTLPLPDVVAARVLRFDEGNETYRDLPPRSLVLSSLVAEDRVERKEEVLRFAPERNWIVARRRAGRQISLALVRVQVSGAPGGLVLRARYFPGDAAMMFLMVAGFAVVRGWHFLGPLGLLFVGIAVVSTLVQQRGRARSCFEGVIEELKSRIASLDPAQAQAQPGGELVAAPPPDPTRWTCACGKVNEIERKTCRRCWAPRRA